MPLAKFYGAVGYAETVESETKPGVWEDHVTERMHYGDVQRLARSLIGADHLNDSISITNQISIIADPYAQNHFFEMRYVRYLGGVWKVTNVEVQTPRLVLTLGGLYNGPTA